VTDAVRAAGGLVWRRRPETQVLLVHRPRYGDWTFPKGKADPGETDEECALREVEEETGVRCALEAEVRATSYHDAKGHPKRVRWWRMHALDAEGPFDPSDEVDAIRWCSRAEAAGLLTYDRDIALLDTLAVVLVRHARAGKRDEWDGDDRLRPLDERGVAQARALVAPLRALGVGSIVSSPFARCVQTVEPLAAALRLSVAESGALAEGAPRADAFELAAAAGPGTVLCTHSDIVEELLEARLRKGAAALFDVAAPSRLRIVGSIPAL
jgi:8-oxo-dGTP pyrophosphatase MutT (NUDIX family)/phosphohistidine phosphatase SixA